MNNAYKLVYSAVLGSWVVVSEHVKGRGKMGTTRLIAVAALLAAADIGTSLALAATPSPPAVNQLPTGAQVAAGAVGFSKTQTATAAQMAITQTSPQAIVNWQGFNVGANAQVQITQPSSTSVLLNRVQSSDPSQIFGQIKANGQVFLTNPSGVYFAPGSSVDVGSFTATTHGISDVDFLNGNYNFNRNGATGSILNQGRIQSGLGGFIALLAPEVRNQGVVVAQVGGTVALAAGESYQMQFSANNQLTQVLVTPATIQTLVDNGQAVEAPGGLVILSAQAASNLLGGVVKNSGTVSATGLVDDGGTIRLSASHKIELAQSSSISADAAANSAGSGGRIDIIADLTNLTSSTQVSGTISAKAGEQGGNGGFVETSAMNLKVSDTARVSTLAPRGMSGEWLLDPNDFTVADSGGDLSTANLLTALNSNNVTITTTAGDASCASVSALSCGVGTAGNGDITISSAISGWTDNTLTLSAYRDVNFNAAISGSGSSALSVTSGTSGTGTINIQAGTITTAARQTYAGAVNMGSSTTLTTTNEAVTFSSTVDGTSNLSALTVNGALSVAGGTSNLTALTVNSTSNSTVRGAIAGATAVTKSGGGGVLILSGNSTYTGGTTISGGTVQLGSSSNMGFTSGPLGTGAVNLSGGRLDLYGQSIANDLVSTYSTGSLGAIYNSNSTTPAVASGNLALGSDSNIGGSNDFTLGGTISGSFRLTKVGVSKITLLGSNSYSGGTTISAGTLKLGSATALGTAVVSVTSGAALDLNGQTMTSTADLTLNGSGISSGGALTNSSATNGVYAGAINLASGSTIGSATGGIVLTDVLSGSANLTKNGAGTLTLSGRNFSSGVFNVNAGTLALSNSTHSNLTSITVNTGGTLDFKNANFNRPITLSGGVLSISTGASTLSGVVSGGTLTKTGNGMLVLSNANTYSGGTTVSAGTLRAGISSTGSLTNGPFGTNTVTVSGGTVDLYGYSVANALALTAANGFNALIFNSNSATPAIASGSIVLGTNSIVGGNGDLALSGVISSNGYGLALLGAGAKTLSNTSNTLTTIATGFGVGALNITNNAALAIGQVTLGVGTFSGIDSTGTVSVLTRSGDLTVSQNVATTSTSANTTTPALKLSAGDGTAAGTISGGNVVLSGSPDLLVGSDGIAAIFTGSIQASTGVASNIGAKSPNFSLYNTVNTSLPASGAGYYVLFRESGVPIYLLPASGQTSEYGSAPVLNYWYSSSPSSLVPVAYAGIPTAAQTYSLVSGAVSNNINVSSGLTGSLALTGSPSIAADGLVSSTNAGTYALTLTPSLSLAGYIFSAGNAVNYTINPKPITVTSASRTSTYDGVATYANLTSSTPFSISAMVGADTVTSVTQSSTPTGVAQAGSFTVTPSSVVIGTGSAGNYSFSYVPGTHTVNQAPLTVTAANATKIYDGTTYSGGNGVSYNGFVNSETVAVMSGTLTYNGTSQGATNADSYVITPAGLISSNYAVSFADGSLTISPAGVSVASLTGSTIKVYDGNTSATLTPGNFTLTGFVAGEGATVSKTSGTFDAANAGTIKTVSTALSSGDFASTGATLLSNYILPTSASGAIGTITPAPLSVTADNASKTYDGTSYSGGNGLAYSGFVNNETQAVLGGTVAYTGTSQGAKNAGSYVITPAGLTSSNYNVSFVDGSLTISPAGVSAIVASLTGSTSKVYDGNTSATLNPGNFALTGFVPGEGASVIQTGGTYDTANAGTGKTVTASLASGDFTASNGTLLSNYMLPTGASGAIGTITQAPLTVSAASDTKTYDGSAYTGGNGVNFNGFVNGETPAVLGGSLAYYGNSQGARNAGSYLITPGGLSSSNYAVSFVDGGLTVAKAALTATGRGAVVTYNGANQSVSGFTVSGLQGSDTVAVLSNVAAAGATGKNAGSYANTVTAGTETNYTVTPVPGSLDIAKARATVTANSASVIYNGANQTVSGITATGLVGGETTAVLTGVSATRTAKNAGSYINTASGTDSNYNLVFVPGSLDIAKAALTATGNSAAVTYNGANQSVSGFTVVGLQGSDTVSDLSNVAAASATGKNAGSYANTVTSDVETNYTVTPMAGSLDITKSNATVTADSALVIYNGANQTVSGFTVTGMVGGETTAVLTGVSATRTAKNAGSYINTASGTDSNYNLVFVPGSLDIAKAALTATGNSAAVTYNGANQSVSGFTVAGLQGSDTVADLSNVIAAGATARNVGRYANTVTAGIEANYSVNTVAGALEIAKAPLVLTAQTNTKSFDGNTSAAAVPETSGLQGADTVSNLTQAYADANPGNDKRLTVQDGYRINDTNAGGNYELSRVINQTGVIRALPVAVLPPQTALVTTNYALPVLAVAASSASSSSSTGLNTGSSSGVTVITVNPTTQHTPGLVVVLVPVGTATAGTGVRIALPEAVFAAAQQAANTEQVTMPDRQPLPAWISYDAANKTVVTGAVPEGAFPITLWVLLGGQVTVVQISEAQAKL